MNPIGLEFASFEQSRIIWSFTVLSDRTALTNLCLLGVLAFLVLSSGALQCVYNCMEEDASRRAASRYEVHASAHLADCHLTFPEPKQMTNRPDRSCHQSQATNRSLGGPVLTNYSSTSEPLLNSPRSPLPEIRIVQSFKQKTLPQPVLLASWQPPTTISQTLMGVKTTVLLN